MAIRERMSEFVVDASVAAVWIFEDETHPIADIALAEIQDNGNGLVPRHWYLEVRNALIVGERRRRIRSDQLTQRLSFLNELPLQTDTRANLDAAFEMARIYDLSMYDAMYLELAHRRRLLLVTLDRGLSRAASAAGVEVLP